MCRNGYDTTPGYPPCRPTEGISLSLSLVKVTLHRNIGVRVDPGRWGLVARFSPTTFCGCLAIEPVCYRQCIPRASN
jgi:hypothetical protein